MGRASTVMGVVGSFALLLGVTAFVPVQPANASATHRSVAIKNTSTTGIWTPSSAPLPATLPDGNAPTSSSLNNTSCSSSSFCVAVGAVDDATASYPLVETYADGAWTPSIAPVPANQLVENGAPYLGELMSVSCPTDGTCAAVGLYDAAGVPDGSTYVAIQEPLLDYLSDGVWTTSEGALPSDLEPGRASNQFSVSCPSATTCMAIGNAWGEYDGQGGEDQPGDWQALIYILNDGSWQLQGPPPLPANYQDNLTVSSVSCPDVNDCVVVGSYGYYGTYNTSLGLILTDSSGVWSAEEAPLPSNADDVPARSGMQVLDAVDCVDAGDCVAGGSYEDTTGNVDPFFDTLQAGTWTASEAPVPANAEVPSQGGDSVTGISCPAEDACVADGSYWINYLAGDESGMLYAQSSSGWTVAPAPLPNNANAPFMTARRHKTSKSSLQGLSCVSTTFCRAVGQDGKRALIEKMRKR